jgi:hypothetical protein
MCRSKKGLTNVLQANGRPGLCALAAIIPNTSHDVYARAAVHYGPTLTPPEGTLRIKQFEMCISFFYLERLLLAQAHLFVIVGVC